jgi:hypothetical protein
VKGERPRAKTKRTTDGKIMGRPVGAGGFAAHVAPRTKQTCIGLRQPKPIADPITGELRRPFGPGLPIYEMREVRRGRPALTTSQELLRIVQAVSGFDRCGFAETQETYPRAESAKAIAKRRLRLTKSQILSRGLTRKKSRWTFD